jgi:hypothetical protein
VNTTGFYLLKVRHEMSPTFRTMKFILYDVGHMTSRDVTRPVVCSRKQWRPTLVLAGVN